MLGFSQMSAQMRNLRKTLLFDEFNPPVELSTYKIWSDPLYFLLLSGMEVMVTILTLCVTRRQR